MIRKKEKMSVVRFDIYCTVFLSHIAQRHDFLFHEHVNKSRDSVDSGKYQIEEKIIAHSR